MSAGDIIREAMKARGMTQAQLGEAVGVTQQTIQRLVSKGEGSMDLLTKVASALELNESQRRAILMASPIALGGTAIAPRSDSLSGMGRVANHLRQLRKSVDISDPDRTIPILGYAAGALPGNGHLIMGGVKGYIPCPPTLAHLDGVFAVYVSGESMSPRFEPGTLVIIHPLEEPRRGDSVVAQIEDPVTGELTGYIKEYVGVRDGQLILKQFNPLEELRFDIASVKGLHKVVIAML